MCVGSMWFHVEVELHHLSCVVAIADHGSFTGAAAALHLSQPTLSYAITRLEGELGARLFDRLPSGTVLTAAGTAFIGAARRAVAEAESGRASVSAVAGLVAGELRLACVRMAVVEAARLVAEFHRRYPALRMMVDDPAGDAGVIELVRSGRCDAGIVRSIEVPGDLDSVAVADSQELVLIFPAATAPRRPTIPMTSLPDIPLIVPVTGTRTRASADEYVLWASGSLPTVVCECSDPQMIVELVRGGVGAAITTASLASTLGLDGIAVRRIRPRTAIELSVVTRSSASPAAMAFCQMVGDAPSGAASDSQ